MDGESDNRSMRSGKTTQLKPSVVAKMEKIKISIEEDPTLTADRKRMMLKGLPKEIMADPRNFVNTNDLKDKSVTEESAVIDETPEERRGRLLVEAAEEAAEQNNKDPMNRPYFVGINAKGAHALQEHPLTTCRK